MVVIRLSRIGRKNFPKFRVTVSDSRRSATKKFLEIVGTYSPLAQGKEPKVVLNLEKIQAWVSKGAQPTDRVKHLMKLAQVQVQTQTEIKQ